MEIDDKGGEIVQRYESLIEWGRDCTMGEMRHKRNRGWTHYYTNFTGGRRFGFPTVGKAIHRGLEATVNRGLTAAGGVTCPPR